MFPAPGLGLRGRFGLALPLLTVICVLSYFPLSGPTVRDNAATFRLLGSLVLAFSRVSCPWLGLAWSIRSGAAPAHGYMCFIVLCALKDTAPVITSPRLAFLAHFSSCFIVFPAFVGFTARREKLEYMRPLRRSALFGLLSMT